MVLTVACPTQRGIVAAVASFLARHGCNITDSAQFDDLPQGRFFMRVSFRSETGAGIETLRAAFAETAATFGMDHAFHSAAHRMRASSSMPTRLGAPRRSRPTSRPASRRASA